MLLTCLSALGVDINSKRFWARFQGDDSICAFHEQMYRIYGPSFLIQLSATAMYYFNAKLSVTKTQFSDSPNGISVLSYFNSYGIPFRTDEDLLSHLFFPERYQDFGQLAASAMGLAYANCGHSERFHALCEYIFIKIVKEKGKEPDYDALNWMVRTGMFPTIATLEGVEFPSITTIRAQVYVHEPTAASSKARQWPTANSPKGRFYFSLNV